MHRSAELAAIKAGDHSCGQLTLGAAHTSVGVVEDIQVRECACLQRRRVAGQQAEILGVDALIRPERIEKICEDTRDAAYPIIDAKGSTSYGIGMGLARITRAVIQNQAVVLPVSAYLQG